MSSGARKLKAKKEIRMCPGILLPKPEHPYGYTIKQVEEILTKTELKKFDKWFIGQTCTGDNNGNMIVYTHDLERFVRLVRNNTPTYWD